LAIALALLIGWLVTTSAVFSTSFVMISLLDTLLALGVPVLASIGIDITLETLRRRQTEFLLGSLHRIAEQRLQIDQAAEYILEDVSKIAPGSIATLYIVDNSDPERWMRFRWGEKRVVGIAASPDNRTYHSTQMRAFPLLWQGRQQGLLMLQLVRGAHIDGTAGVLLQELVEKLAPHIDNMLLYDEIERQKLLLDSVFAESPAGIAILDGKGRIVQCNQDLARLLETPLSNLRGKSLPEYLSLKANKQELDEHVSNGISAKTLFLLDELKLGAYSVRLVIAPLKAYDLWTVIISDVTALVELSNLKTRMLRIASHDLKNPLARIKGFVDLIFMLSTTLSEQDRKYLQFISDAGDEMLRIIDDILNLERMRSGKPMLSNINLSQMVQEVCARNQPDLLQKQQTMDIIIPDTSLTVRADAAQLSQAINNFVGNAIKYTPESGRVTVRLKSDGQTIRFEVEDTGYGIPAKAQPKIFSEFYRAKAEGTLHIPGTGLGLSLVKAVIESHDGTVGFTSVEGQGSTFYLTLPEK
jgi:signal transduction histidine kinase